MANIVCLIIMLSSFQLVRAKSHNLTISPDHTRVPTNHARLTFTCSADVTLTKCQFQWWSETTEQVGPLLDLSHGADSQVNGTHLSSELRSYSYVGRGLSEGDCGISMEGDGGHKNWMVACRVQAEDGGWKYAWADVYASDDMPLFSTVQPREAVVLQGGDVRFESKAGSSLKSCLYYLPNVPQAITFDKGHESNNVNARFRYIGGGLEDGECGLMVTNVSESDNGPVSNRMGTSPSAMNGARLMVLIVARPPTRPTMHIAYDGTTVTAACEVGDSRPAPKISWILGDEVIREDELDDSPVMPEDEWRWPWKQGSFLQSLTLSLQANDNGKVLKCQVSHVTLPQPLAAEDTILFPDPAATTPDNTCTTSSIQSICEEFRTRLENVSCPKDEVHEYRLREAKTASRTADLMEAAAKIALEAARSSARAEKARATSAEETLQFERERRSHGCNESRRGD